MTNARTALTLAAIAAAALLLPPAAASAAPARASASCTFQVVHNDRIGSVSFPAGNYAVGTSGLSCGQMVTLFARFLQYPSGLLPSPWRLNARTKTFSNGRGQSFRVGGGRPSPPAPPAGRCSSKFHVLHNDRIGALRLPQGWYYIDVRNINCGTASSLFTEFLQDWDGVLPAPWRVIASQRRFVGGSRSFVVTRAGSPGPSPSPSGERLCNTTPFRVRTADRIGRLRIPAGNYNVWLLPGRGLTCAAAYGSLSQFLARTDGRLPQPWTVDPETGTFLRGRTYPPVGFRIDPGARTGGVTPS